MEYLITMWDLARAGEKQGVLFFIAVYCFLIMSISLIGQLRMRQWPSVTGKLLEGGPRTIGGSDRYDADTRYVVSALYEYEISGRRYQGKRVSPWIFVTNRNAKGILDHQFKSVDRQGDLVKIFYNPTNPKKSTLLKPGKFGLCISFVIWIGPMLCYLTSYH